MTLGKFKPFLLGTGLVVGAVAIVVGLGALKPETEKEETKKPPLVVRTAEAQLKEQTVYSTFQGEVRAKTNIELVTQVTGKVMSVSDRFIEGGEFEAGETLLQIDDSDYLVALKSAEASVASAQVDLDVEIATSVNKAKEWSDLQGKPIEQANPLLLNKPQIDRAKARFDAAQAELAAAKLNYDRTRISAPFKGRIMSKSAELGKFMSRGSSIGRVFATDAMEVRIPMTDVQISELGLRLGYSSQGTGTQGIPATVSTLFGDQQQMWQGFVKSVDASVDSQTRLLFATVVVDQPFQKDGADSIPLVPGLFVDVELASPKKLVGIELPRTALRNGNQVFAYDNDELKLKRVKVVYTSMDKVIVAQDASTINIGEMIITSSVPGAYEGMPIKLVASGEEEVIADAGETEADTQSSSETEATEQAVKEEQNDEPSDADSVAETVADSAGESTDEAVETEQVSEASPEVEENAEVEQLTDGETGASDDNSTEVLTASHS